MATGPPPGAPLAVSTKPADSPSASGEGKRTRSEPDSWSWPRRVIAFAWRAADLTPPPAPLAAKIAEAVLVVSDPIAPNSPLKSARTWPVASPSRVQGPLAVDFAPD